MATTPEEEFEGRTHIGEEARQIVESVRVRVAGSRDAKAAWPIVLGILAAVMVVAPWPANIIGVALLVELAYMLGWKRV